MYTHTSRVSFDFTTLGSISNKDFHFLFDRLLEAIGVYFKIRVGYFLESRNIFHSTPHLKQRYSLTIKGDQFCFPLLPDVYSENFAYIPFPDNEKPPWMRFGWEVDFLIFADIAVLYSEVFKSEALYRSDGSDDKLYWDKMNYEEATLGFAVGTRVSETRAGIFCSPELVPAVCVARRLLDDTIQHCECVSVIYWHLLREGF